MRRRHDHGEFTSSISIRTTRPTSTRSSPALDSRKVNRVWINDGTGHFTTLKVGDFVAAGRESLLGGKPYLVATRHGYSFITLQNFGAGNGLRVTGLLATTPYRIAPVPSPLRH